MTQSENKSFNRSFYQSKLFWSVMLALVLGLLAWGRLNNIRAYNFDVPLDNPETPAQVRVELDEGLIDITTLEGDSDQLFQAAVTAPGVLELTTNTARESVDIDLSYIRPSPLVALLFGRGRAQQQWELNLYPFAETALILEGGNGIVTAEIEQLNLTELTVTDVLGTVALDLPAPIQRYTVNLGGGLGNVDLTVPTGADIDLTIGGDVGSVDITVSEKVNAVFNIMTDIGDVTIDIDDDSPLQVIVAESDGEVTLPDQLTEVETSRYETETFATAGAKIAITYAGTLGDFTVR